MDYTDLFARNVGIFDAEQQRRLRDSRVLIVGSGGVGGTVAAALARTGVGSFILVDFDDYEPSNANRQIACFADTMGRNKAEVVGEELRRINPDVEVHTVPQKIPLDEIDEWIEASDLVFPAADDYAYSLMVFRRCRALGRPALLVVPAGLWSVVTLVLPEGPTVERLTGVPDLGSYDELHALFQTHEAKLGTNYYVRYGGWREDYWIEHVEGHAPIAQICPAVWLGSSLGALQVVRLLSGYGGAVTAPRYWLLSDRGGVSLRSMHGLGFHAWMARYRRFAYWILQGPLGGLQRRLQDIYWDWMKRRYGR